MHQQHADLVVPGLVPFRSAPQVKCSVSMTCASELSQPLAQTVNTSSTANAPPTMTLLMSNVTLQTVLVKRGLRSEPARLPTACQFGLPPHPTHSNVM